MSARQLLIAFSVLTAGCAGRALPQPAVATPPPQASAAGQAGAPAGELSETAPPRGERAEHGAHGPPAFPEIRGSSAAVASYSDRDPALEGHPDPALEIAGEAPATEGAAPAHSPLIVNVPEGVTPLLPFDPPAPSVLPPPVRPPPPRAPAPRWNPAPLPPPRVTVSVPGGEACLRKLALAGVEFRSLEEVRGVDTPIQLQGTIGGIRYHSGFGPMVSDCRFALALATAAPELVALGVSEIHFSGAYSYRTSRVGRLSLHAYGLALDVHEIVVGGRRLSVERDFARGIGCGGLGPALNRVACRLRELGLFRELLTPDYNADHNNHFHLGVPPLGPLANELWAKRPTRHPSPQLPVFGNGSRRVADTPAAEPKPGRKSTREDRKRKPSTKEAAARADSKPGVEPRPAKADALTDPDPPAKQERTAKGNKVAKRASEKQPPKQAKRERTKRPERDVEQKEKRSTKPRKRERFTTPEPSPKQKPVKAAKRSDAKREKGSS